MNFILLKLIIQERSSSFMFFTNEKGIEMCNRKEEMCMAKFVIFVSKWKLLLFCVFLGGVSIGYCSGLIPGCVLRNHSWNLRRPKPWPDAFKAKALRVILWFWPELCYSSFRKFQENWEKPLLILICNQ